MSWLTQGLQQHGPGLQLAPGDKEAAAAFPFSKAGVMLAGQFLAGQFLAGPAAVRLSQGPQAGSLWW